MSLGYCRKCRAPLVPKRRFCGQCGHPSPAEERSQLERIKKRSSREQSAILATAVVFVGSIFAILAPLDWATESALASSLFHLVLDLGVALLGAWCLGGRSELKATWGQRSEPRWLGIALLLGCVAFAISHTYVESLSNLFGWEESPEGEAAVTPMAFLILDVVILTAIIEEWLCRGVLWAALERIAGKWAVITLTAFLFALLHSFNGGFVFEWPHRFALGLICGWLRFKSGSLWPGVLAHAVNNAFAVGFDSV